MLSVFKFLNQCHQRRRNLYDHLQSLLNLVVGFIHITVKRNILTGEPQKASFHYSSSNTISTK
ncbi:hypothetical protein MKX03_004573, partial [Papaver bracteatum]